MTWFPGKPCDGAAAGVRFGGSGGSSPSGTTTQTQQTAPWSVQQPFLQQGFTNAQALANTGGPNYYPGTTFAPETPTQQAALGYQAQLGLTGSPVTGAASSAMTNILNPNFLNSNPANGFYNGVLSGDSPAINAAVARAAPGLEDQFTGGGAVTKPSSAPFAISRGIGDAVAGQMMGAAQGLGTNYNTAAGQQNSAAAFGAPAAQGLAYNDLSQAYNAGATQQGQNQQVIDDAINRWNYGQTQPYNLLDWYNGAVGGSYGSTGSLTTPYFTQQTGGFGGALSGGLAGAGTGAMIGSVVPGIGTAAGAIGGGIIGALGGGLG